MEQVELVVHLDQVQVERLDQVQVVRLNLELVASLGLELVARLDLQPGVSLDQVQVERHLDLLYLELEALHHVWTSVLRLQFVACSHWHLR